MERKYEKEREAHVKATLENIWYRDFAQRLVKKNYKENHKANKSSFEDAIDSALEEIESIMTDFTTQVYFGKLVINENKPHCVLIRTDIADDTIRTKYYLNMECDTSMYDAEIAWYKSSMTILMVNAMFPDEIEEEYSSKIKACEMRKARTIERNPPLKFWWTLLKFEDKNKEEKWYEWTFKINSDTAIMLIKQQSSFTSYLCNFTKRDWQHATEVETEIVNK